MINLLRAKTCQEVINDFQYQNFEQLPPFCKKGLKVPEDYQLKKLSKTKIKKIISNVEDRFNGVQDKKRKYKHWNSLYKFNEFSYEELIYLMNALLAIKDESTQG